MHLSGEAPLPGEFGFLPLDELRRDLPDDLEERVLLARRLRERAPDRARARDGVDRARLVVDVDHHHDNNRFGDVNLIVADASSTAEIVRDLLARARRCAHAGDRRGAVRRARHRHRPLPVHEHHAEGAAARGRARRGRRRRARHLPARLRDGAVREAEAARARARPCAAVRGRAAARLVSRPQRLRRRRRGGAVLGGDHRLPAPGRGRRARRADPRAADATAARRTAISLRSSQDEVDVSAIARQSGGGGHRQAAGFSSETRSRRSSSSSARDVRRRDAASRCRRETRGCRRAST